MQESRVVKPKFSEDFPEAVAREGLRGEEGMLRTFVDATNVGDSRWEVTAGG